MALNAEQIGNDKFKSIVTPKERKFLKRSRIKKIRLTSINKPIYPNKYDGWAT